MVHFLPSMQFLRLCENERMSQPHPLQNNEFMLITSVTAHREPLFGDPAVAREAIETMYRVKQRQSFFLYGFVVMPDHCHFLMMVRWPQAISKIMNTFKTGVAFNTGLGSMWQKGFHMQVPDDLKVALKYIHFNPVRAGIVRIPETYPWSSASAKWDVSPLPVVGFSSGHSGRGPKGDAFKP